MRLHLATPFFSLLLVSSCSAPLPPNIIIVHVDDLGWTDLSCFGSAYYETPQIDRLAREGMSFTNAYAAAAVCSPSRAALLTGRYPARLGITDWIRARFNADSWEPGTPIPEFESAPSGRLLTPFNQPFLPHEEATIAEHLKEAGYATAHIGKWHLGREDWYPTSQGFDVNIGGCDFGQPPSYFDPYENDRVRGIPTLPPRRTGEYLTEREQSEVEEFVRTYQDQPFFLYYAPYAVHTPIQAKPDVEKRYEGKTKTNHTNPAYAAMVESVDDAVGGILETLRELNLNQRTLILFTSDNGGLMPVTDNAPLRDGKGSPYEGGIRVPLIAWWPGVIPSGSSSDLPLSSIDYLPTIADLVGINQVEFLDGISFWPVLRGDEATESRDLYWHFPHYRYDQVGPYSIVRSGTWKLIRFYDPGPYGVNRVELFNLTEDLKEEHDLSSVEVDKAAELEALLDVWLESVEARLPVERPEPFGEEE